MMVYYFYSAYCLLVALAAGLTGLSLMKKGWSFLYKLMAFYTCLQCIVETYLFFTKHYGRPVNWLHNVIVPVETAITIYFLTRQARRRSVQKLFEWFCLYLILTLVISFRIQHFSFHYTNIYEIIFMLFAYLVVSCVFIVDVFLSDDDMPIFRMPAVWVAFGTLIYAALFLILFSITLKLFDYSISRGLFMAFSIVANTVQYGSLIAGFLVYSREFTRKNIAK